MYAIFLVVSKVVMSSSSSIDLMLGSTLDEYSQLLFYPFPLLPSFRLLQPDGESLELDATANGNYYMEAADDRE